MKKIIFILFTVFIAFSCKDFNEDNFDWYEDAERPTNLANYQYTMTDADYTIIVNALKATGTDENTALANKLSSAKKFSPELDPAQLIPYLLENKYYTADVKSSAMITYMYDDARDEVLSGLSTTGYTMVSDDYKSVWGTSPLVLSLTPAKSANSQIPNILKTRFTDAVAGDYKTVEYYYSDEEPVTTTVESVFFEQKFEGYTAGSGVAVNIDGWINKDVTGGSIFWQMRTYSSNNYAQVSSYQSAAKNEVWLITPNVDLTNSTTTPKFSFDIITGNYTAAGLRIMISEDFDGTVGDIATANWTDVTSSFTIPAPASGYSTWATAGTLDLTAYKGKKIYIGFKYMGDDTSTPKVTTTYQLDNVKVWEEVSGTDVESKYTQYATYTYNGSAWSAVGSGILTLQPEDYTKLTLSSGTMTTAQAQTLLPQYLGQNFIGTEKVVVYRTSAGVYYADRVVYDNQWTVQSTLSEESSQFVRAEVNNSKVWIFDPTIIVSLAKSDYQIVVDYVIDHYKAGDDDVVHANSNAEYYYGFSTYYGNVSYREVDRGKDDTYPMDASQDEKVTFMNQRTVEGLIIVLNSKYPNATPIVSGVDQYARVDNVLIYSEPGAGTNVYWSYTLQCTGDKEWKFVSREASDGRTETAE
ncbi:hypothetical protein GGR21_001859 [Dysgonomonas hofstadii]|uniref:DUF5017 domain-containing protein n=1 Tax=Dysgonomonas hofstadii TaxID=637886 RepID=A0A840CQT2_9BACT|nr:choice-of-anchor J domain-containing protein [Dysgonomonas hofstadii]MBB4035964.1 hypothetical protein [Dysgonomonas hofstadii]